MSVPPLRIVYFGTPAFAVPTLRSLIGSRHSVVGVVSQETHLFHASIADNLRFDFN